MGQDNISKNSASHGLSLAQLHSPQAESQMQTLGQSEEQETMNAASLSLPKD